MIFYYLLCKYLKLYLKTALFIFMALVFVCFFYYLHCLSTLKWSVVADSVLSFTQKHMWRCESIFKQYLHFGTCFLEKLMNFWKFCGFDFWKVFFTFKKKYCVGHVALCRIFISKYHWIHWLTFWYVVDIIMLFCISIIWVAFISMYISFLCLFHLIKSLVN